MDDERGTKSSGVSRREFASVAAAAAAGFLLTACGPRKLHEMPRDRLRAAVKELEREYTAQYGRSVTVSDAGPMPGVLFAYALDLSRCIGCRRCVYACVEENNQSRDPQVHWIRVLEMDKEKGVDFAHANAYYEAETVPRDGHFYLPVACQQCEEAPCENVCPVNATTHSPEGLNDMAYNRCIGTRYCANNCPYKVRRFNFLLYQDWETPQLQLQRNPNVTVRSRGVMEKCTYCVQRINQARITSEREGRKVRDGEIRTACEQACPTHAIVFGNQNDPESAVSRAKKNPRNYALLEELGTRPRTTYLAMVRNPNPELVG